MTMGTQYRPGYSATVEGFLVVGDERFRLGKTNDRTLTLADPCELAPGTIAEILIIVDGDPSSRMVEIPGGIFAGQCVVEYFEFGPS